MRGRLPRGPDGSALVDVLEIKDSQANREHTEECLKGLSWSCSGRGTVTWGAHFPHYLPDLLDTKTVKSGNPHKLVVIKKPASERIAELKDMTKVLQDAKRLAQDKSFEEAGTASPKLKRHRVE